MMINPISKWTASPSPNFKSARGVRLPNEEIEYIKQKIDFYGSQFKMAYYAVKFNGKE